MGLDKSVIEKVRECELPFIPVNGVQVQEICPKKMFTYKGSLFNVFF